MLTNGNASGGALEQFVETLCRGYGFHVRGPDDETTDLFAPLLLLKQVPYRNVFDANGRCDFVLCADILKRKIAIECKWQASEGSVFEKFPLVLHNALFAFPQDEVILLIDGEGTPKGAVNWLRKHAGRPETLFRNAPKKEIRVFSMSEFKSWLEKFVKGKV